MKCDLREVRWHYTGAVTECSTRNLNITSPDLAVTSVNGETESKSEAFALNIEDQRVNFLPRGIENFRPNLLGINIINSSLRQISQADLKPFFNLKVVILESNEIDVIPDNLFAFNPELKQISLNKNPIKAFGENVIPIGVVSVNFENIDCAVGSAFVFEQQEMISNLRKKIRRSCLTPDEFKKKDNIVEAS